MALYIHDLEYINIEDNHAVNKPIAHLKKIKELQVRLIVDEVMP
jgi:hypothetical protein